MNRAEAQGAGLLCRGVSFAQPSAGPGDAVGEADHFLDTAGSVRGDLIPVLDLERSGDLSQMALQAWVRGYLERVEQRSGIRGMIYVSPDFWRTYTGDTTWFGANGYEVLWVAHWTTGVAPRVPGGTGPARAGRSGSTPRCGAVSGDQRARRPRPVPRLGLPAGPDPVGRRAPGRSDQVVSRRRRCPRSAFQSTGASSQTPSQPR